MTGYVRFVSNDTFVKNFNNAPFLNSKHKNERNKKGYGTRFSMSSFNLLLYLKNSKVPSLKTTFNWQLIFAKT